MDALLATVQNFFTTIAGIIEAFFGFFAGLLPTTTEPKDENDAPEAE